MATVAGKLNTYLEAFGELTAERQERDPLWLRQLREDAWQRFHAKGFPTPHDEDWRFTNLAALAKTPFQRAVKGSVAVDGVSLTVNEVRGDTFGVNIIPHTASVTAFGTLRPNDPVNIEIDTLARYVARLAETA